MILLETKEVISIFRENGYKVTPQRIAICKFMLSRKDHPTASQIYEEVKKEYPTLSLGTVYKTLNLLKELNLVQELSFDSGINRYDPCMDLHINLVCSKCGKIYDYESDKVKELWKVITSDTGVTPRGHRIDIYYHCEDCS